MSKDIYRREVHRRKRLTKTWRRPKGRHSKVKRKERFVQKMPSSRNRSKAETRNMHPSGFNEILVRNVGEISVVDPKKYVVRIARVGRRKKIEMLEKAKKMKIKVININIKKIPEKKEKPEKKKAKEKPKPAEEKQEEKPKPKKEKPKATKKEKPAKKTTKKENKE
jgi:large subunit ribosomal protein L32e